MTCRLGLLLCPRAAQYAMPNRLAGSVSTLSLLDSSTSTVHSRDSLDATCKSCTATTGRATATAPRSLGAFLSAIRHPSR